MDTSYTSENAQESNKYGLIILSIVLSFACISFERTHLDLIEELPLILKYCEIQSFNSLKTAINSKLNIIYLPQSDIAIQSVILDFYLV